MRFLLLVSLAAVLTSCDFFSEPDNRPPRIAWGEFFVDDVRDVFDVTMRVGAADPDGNLDRIDCTGDVAYSGPSPADTTVSFPLDQSGEQVHSECTAVDTDGERSIAVRMHLILQEQ